MERSRVKTVRFSEVEARLLDESAEARSMSVSDVVREAVILWRERLGDRQDALETWAARLLAEHGPGAQLTARVNDGFSVDVDVDGMEIDEFVSEGVFDGSDQLQLWVGDPDSDARAYLGRVRVLAGAAITVPVRSLPALGASDAHAV